jgi:hypothetical protein
MFADESIEKASDWPGASGSKSGSKSKSNRVPTDPDPDPDFDFDSDQHGSGRGSRAGRRGQPARLALLGALLAAGVGSGAAADGARLGVTTPLGLDPEQLRQMQARVFAEGAVRAIEVRSAHALTLILTGPDSEPPALDAERIRLLRPDGTAQAPARAGRDR